MTAQIDDVFRYNGKDHSITGISEGELFDPSLLDLKPSAASTACYRGYQAIFSINCGRLVLDTLKVCLRSDDAEFQDIVGPVVNQIKPTKSKRDYDQFNNHYGKLNYHLQYSGGLLIAAGFIQKLYVHLGFHPPWKYRKVFELIFDQGLLVGEFDRSDQMAEVRSSIIESQRNEMAGERRPTVDIKEFIDRAFDRSYDL